MWPGNRTAEIELDLVAVEPWPAPFARSLLHVGGVGDCIELYARDQVVVLGAQAFDDLAGSVVGVGDEVQRILEGNAAKQADHLVQQGAPIAVGPYQAFMDAHSQRHGQDTVCGSYEHACHGSGESHEAAQARERWAQQPDRVPPGQPKRRWMFGVLLILMHSMTML